MKKKVLITGTSGMLGGALVNGWSQKFEIFELTGKRQFDFNKTDYSSLKKLFNPDVIVHCAALIKMDYCEKNPEKAFSVNGESVSRLHKAFPETKIIFISSEAVFPLNTKNATEKTPAGAVTVYGKSKELGESYIEKYSCGTVIRTTIVGRNISNPGKSLAEWIVSSLKNNQPITLFDDVWFTPISVWQLGDALEWVVENPTPSILHIGGDEKVTKYQFGLELAKVLDLPTSLIKRGKLLGAEFTAPRSNETSLNSSLYEQLSGNKAPSLSEVIKSVASYF